MTKEREEDWKRCDRRRKKWRETSAPLPRPHASTFPTFWGTLPRRHLPSLSLRTAHCSLSTPNGAVLDFLVLWQREGNWRLEKRGPFGMWRSQFGALWSVFSAPVRIFAGLRLSDSGFGNWHNQKVTPLQSVYSAHRYVSQCIRLDSL